MCITSALFCSLDKLNLESTLLIWHVCSWMLLWHSECCPNPAQVIHNNMNNEQLVQMEQVIMKRSHGCADPVCELCWVMNGCHSWSKTAWHHRKHARCCPLYRCASFCSSNVLTSLSQFPPSRYCSTCHFPFTVSGKRISGGKWADRCRHLCQLLVATWSSEPAMDGTVLMNAICYLNIYFVGWHIVLVLCCSFLFLHC